MRAAKLRLLLVEPEAGDAERFCAALEERAQGEFVVGHTTRLASALEYLERDPCDLVVLDLDLRDADGLEALDAVRTAHPSIPIVVIASRADRGVALSVLERGAHAFVPKNWADPSEILDSVRSALGRRRALEDLAAVTDSLRSAELRLKKLSPTESRLKKVKLG